MNKIKIGLFCLLVLLLSGCENDLEKDKTYCFVGDSIIALWSLAETLPSWLVYNYGKSGAGISYIQGLQGRFSDKDVVVMIGTNDSYRFVSENMDEYVSDYLKAINNLTDKNIYLFSVLPREFDGDYKDINNYISQFNGKVRAAISAYPNITYLDVYSDFMYEHHINYQYYSDGLHLNSFGYEVLSSKLIKVIEKN